jgi:hypothetical protein
MTLQPLSFINRVTRRVSLEKQEVPTLPEHLRLHCLPFFDLQILITPFGIFKLFLMNTMSTNNDLQSTPKKTKDRATKTPLKTRD